MNEDFLHYLWKYKKFNVSNLKTANNQQVIIHNVGEHNKNSGPDFFNAKLEIDNQLWAGNVEIHIKSSDWFIHNHEKDRAYDNVILHVVWEHDIEVFRKDNTEIPTLELKSYVQSKSIENFQQLFNKKRKWINCENDFQLIDDFTLHNWLERLYFERLEKKFDDINGLLEASKNDWEAVLFKMLCKNFGLKVNGNAFFSLSDSFDFSIIRKLHKPISLEALFFGQANLLGQDLEVTYYSDLKEEYQFLKQKFKLFNKGVLPIQFFRLRPPNFPTIRLSQLAMLYSTKQNLFSDIISVNKIEEIYRIFEVSTSRFWETHYTFSKTSKTSKKKLSKAFIDLLIINTVVPLKFSYAKYQGKSIDNELIAIIGGVALEKNNIIKGFSNLKPIFKSAFQSQALLELKNEYCSKNKCLQCAVGSALLNRNM